ncbi:MAG: carbon monoxide dehydrogenase [Burkholderiaceae bacterium]|nr:MAG: carbon monoxide dehydrogenase [Burkholderiaceae bacterium]TAM05900.1 MAG: carbon monoxide dehydrogenase [Pusillimonas sp.]
MKPTAFEYCRPERLDEALDLLAQYGPDVSILAGGMSLGPMLNMRLVRPRILMDIKRVSELGGVQVVRDGVHTGARLVQADAFADAELMNKVPLLALGLPNVGHFQTRNRGTLVGSVAHADPSAEVPLCLTTLGGSIELCSKQGKRIVPASEFFQGALTTVRRGDEMLTGLIWPLSEPRVGYGFQELAQRHGDFAIAAVACAVVLDESGLISTIRVGVGGVEDRPYLADTTRVRGARACHETACALASDIAEAVDPMSDLKASAAYRRALVLALVERSVMAAFRMAGAIE